MQLVIILTVVQGSYLIMKSFNQDIYVTMKDSSTGESCNYYIELEQMKLNLDEQTVATLKDIRNVGAE